MSLLPYQILKFANSLVKFCKDENILALHRIYKLEKQDHFIELLLSKVQKKSDKIKIVYCAYFLLNYPNLKKSIPQILDNLYVLTVDIYEDEKKIDVECGRCEGSGEEECYECRGEGRLDCDYCDGDGKIECNECDGKGTEECNYCDGRGSETETEEDEDGDEIEVDVECVHCDGSGEKNCRNCSGEGNFESPECDGSGDKNCDECGGYGTETCRYCGGRGTEDSEEDYYEINRVIKVVVGSSLMKFEGELMDLEKFRDLEMNDKLFKWDLRIKTNYFQDDETSEDRKASVDMNDNFVEFVDLIKLENYGF